MFIPPKETPKSGKKLLREMNLAAIMKNVREHAPISRADLATRTGLNKTTVSSLVTELLGYNLLHEKGIEAEGVGRPAMMLEMNPCAGYIVSAEVNSQFIRVICANFLLDVVWRHCEAIPETMEQKAIFDRTVKLLQRAISIGAEQYIRLLGVVVGVPGIVEQKDGLTHFASHLDWDDTPLQTQLEKHLKMPVIVDSEANLAALGESFFGAAKNVRDALYIGVSKTVSGSIIHDGRIFRGAGGFAGRFGHMTVVSNGEKCACGNCGCWETLITETALFRVIDKKRNSWKNSQLVEIEADKLTLQDVIDAAESNDGLALHALEQIGRDLGIGIASLANMLNPQLVIFGGTMSAVSEYLLPVANAEVGRRALRWTGDAVKVVSSEHGMDTCVAGGAASVYQNILTQPSTVIKRRRAVLVSASTEKSLQRIS